MDALRAVTTCIQRETAGLVYADGEGWSNQDGSPHLSYPGASSMRLATVGATFLSPPPAPPPEALPPPAAPWPPSPPAAPWPPPTST
ncbi:hypothetical protein [Sorangium sp. So ce233]|uniref:hypothetical protein n=1 Tax=Sorangium sp. So ce233 TaxID=3133290 RepID=UPI003F638295